MEAISAIHFSFKRFYFKNFMNVAGNISNNGSHPSLMFFLVGEFYGIQLWSDFEEVCAVEDLFVLFNRSIFLEFVSWNLQVQVCKQCLVLNLSAVFCIGTSFSLPSQTRAEIQIPHVPSVADCHFKSSQLQRSVYMLTHKITVQISKMWNLPIFVIRHDGKAMPRYNVWWLLGPQTQQAASRISDSITLSSIFLTDFDSKSHVQQRYIWPSNHQPKPNIFPVRSTNTEGSSSTSIINITTKLFF